VRSENFGGKEPWIGQAVHWLCWEMGEWLRLHPSTAPVRCSYTSFATMQDLRVPDDTGPVQRSQTTGVVSTLLQDKAQGAELVQPHKEGYGVNHWYIHWTRAESPRIRPGLKTGM
jgi:hypothetical protein